MQGIYPLFHFSRILNGALVDLSLVYNRKWFKAKCMQVRNLYHHWSKFDNNPLLYYV